MCNSSCAFSVHSKMQMPTAIVLLLTGFLLFVRHASLQQFHTAFSKSAFSCIALSIFSLIKVSCQIFALITYAFCMSCCGCRLHHKDSKYLKEVSLLCTQASFYIFTDVSLQLLNHSDSMERHRIALSHLPSQSNHYERDCILDIRYIWIFRCCLAFYHIMLWQAAFQIHTHTHTGRSEFCCRE